MAHPKRKISKTRRDKRRTHYKAKPKSFKINTLWRQRRRHKIIPKNFKIG